MGSNRLENFSVHFGSRCFVTHILINSQNMNIMLSFQHIFVLFACLSYVALVSANGNAICKKKVGASSYCRSHDTCHGSSKQKCEPSASRSTSSHLKPNLHDIVVTSNPKGNIRFTPAVPTNKKTVLKEPASTKTAPTPKSAIKPSNDTPHPALTKSASSGVEPVAHKKAPVAKKGPHTDKKTSPTTLTPTSCFLDNNICSARLKGSWCKENGYCWHMDHVSCRVCLNTTPKLPPAKVIPQPNIALPAPKAHHHHLPPKVRVSGHDTLVLWAEFPTLEIGEWPHYFSQLIGFVNGNCGNMRFHSLVMRILNPEFQQERGELWQASKNSAFYRHFLSRLKPGVEVHIYPYLLEKKSAEKWSTRMKVRIPLEAAFKFASDWNMLMKNNGLNGTLGRFQESIFNSWRA